MSFGSQVLSFLESLQIDAKLPEGVEVLDPYSNPDTMELTRRFFERFYNDEGRRVFLIGINPGRFGGGVTGIAFTDPINLQEECGIPNEMEKRHELSSKFMYEMIKALGGVDTFYSRFYFTSVSPLGFVKDGKNLNYYDIPELQNALEEFMVESIREQISFGAEKVAYSLGQGKNIKYLNEISKKYELFSEIRPLPHPRWIMQYRLKKKQDFISLYNEELARWYK